MALGIIKKSQGVPVFLISKLICFVGGDLGGWEELRELCYWYTRGEPVLQRGPIRSRTEPCSRTGHSPTLSSTSC